MRRVAGLPLETQGNRASDDSGAATTSVMEIITGGTGKEINRVELGLVCQNLSPAMTYLTF